MPRISLRRVNEWDAPALLKLYRPYLCGCTTQCTEAEPSLQEYIQRIDKYTYGFGWVMCEINSVPMGFCRAFENPFEPENPFSLSLEIYVKGSMQRKGIGSGLIYLITRILSCGNRRELSVNVPAGNTAAISFFKSQGFTETGCHPHQALLNSRIKAMKLELIPDNPNAGSIIKPYLILGRDYENARAAAAGFVKV